MIKTQTFRNIASELQLFPDVDEKGSSIFVIDALFLRIISLQKAAEFMDMEAAMFIKLLDLMGLEFSYLTEEDISIEKTW